MRKKLFLAALGLLGILSFCGCSSDHTDTKAAETTTDVAVESQTEESQTLQAQKEVFAMDTYMSVTAYGENAEAAADAAIEEIERLDALLSTGSETSEVGQINENGGGQLSEDGVYLLEKATTLCQDTEGAFDITVYPVMEAWGFTTQEYQVPEEGALSSLLTLVDGTRVFLNEETKEVSFGKEGMKIDFGGIAKGYTSSKIMDIWKEYGIESGMVNLGGNVQVLGTKVDGSNWRVAVQSPDDSGYLGILEIHDKAVITSGGYERYFEEDGVSYHHIIDPDTGYPAKNGLVSVTIVSEDGTLADGLSTSLYVMGKEKAEEYWKAHSEEFDAILLREDNILYVTEGIAENFTSDLQVEMIEK